MNGWKTQKVTHLAAIATTTWGVYSPTASSGLIHTRVHFRSVDFRSVFERRGDIANK